MLIKENIIKSILSKYGIQITGALHVGAHECEEMLFYTSCLNITQNNVLWLEAMKNKVIENKNRGIPNVYNAVISDKDDEEIIFNISNNGQSSSILEFGTHKVEHPEVKYIEHINMKTITIDTFMKNNNLDPSKYNFWNFDIQGAELLALKGADNAIKYAKAIYLEVNEKELYKGCALIGEIDIYLKEKGFERVLTEMTCHKWGDALYVRK
jgi:FkbM family methyltransferase